ncbi:XcyI family restriction endonuclease [Hugenholtzia roseola]|uniref:XcyI family restriction endonuclease n=1 Tax=Hugenholtzia roseola TaxID=1002 RepID=UPI00040DEA1E|nr:XcyI family restriction endonuclease [Hugenholtzia roseola]
MAKKINQKDTNYKTWHIDQLAKSEFFHQKLHEWKLVEMAEQLETIQGESLSWDRLALGISENAWNKVIHRGIKPVIVFAHPEILQTILGSTAYYRMLAMVSQKSMNQIGGSVTNFETGTKFPDKEKADFLASHLNQIISHLIEIDKNLNAREFDIWRGMSAGSQAQGSWQNAKGEQAEILLRGIIEKRINRKGLAKEVTTTEIVLKNGKIITFSSEPDISILENGLIRIAVEVKGGIDTAAVLERVGAAIKSLRAKEENPNSITILIMQEVAFSATAQRDIELNKDAINHFFKLEQLVDNEAIREQFFDLLTI